MRVLRSLPTVEGLLVVATAAACGPASPKAPPGGQVRAGATVDSEFATVPDSAWVVVTGPTLIAFYPAVSNEQLEADEGLATALDDFSYHIGTAMDSLVALQFSVRYRSGDTVWIRTGNTRSRFLRAPDRATVGYVWTDTMGRRAVLYGVRTYLDLVEYAHEFSRTGRLPHARTGDNGHPPVLPRPQRRNPRRLKREE